MSSQKIVIVNCLLFIGIVAMGAFLLTQETTLPGRPPIAEIQNYVIADLEENPPEANLGGMQLRNLGKKNVFDTIIPMPTPSPSPIPPTPAPPSIDDVTKDWELSGVLTSFGLFKVRNEEFTLKLGESYDQKYRNDTIPVFLDKIDKENWSATLMIKELGIIQRRTLSVF